MARAPQTDKSIRNQNYPNVTLHTSGEVSIEPSIVRLFPLV